MFAQYKFIDARHHVALESAIRNHSVVSGIGAQLLAKLYKLALDGLLNDTPAGREDGYSISKLTDGKICLVSVTESKTGLYLQLARVEGQSGYYLTLGQKWAMEQFSPAHGNVSTVMW